MKNEHHLWDTEEVAQFLGCSTKHVTRLANEGLMPRPVKLRGMVRWPKHVIQAWLEGGCKPLASHNVPSTMG
jgi:predicted DNA-binding transcriptional regulator AlpA